MLKEFKEFIMKGNVIDLAVAVVIGAAFSAVINALVEGIINPIIGALTAGIALDGLSVNILGVEMVYGVLLSAVIKFIIISFVLFLIVKANNKFKKEEPAEVTTKTCPYCKSEVDLKATRCPHCTSELK